MKTPVLTSRALGVVFSGLLLIAGCAQESSGLIKQTNTVSPPPTDPSVLTALAATNSTAAQTNALAEASVPTKAVVPDKVAAENKPPPPNVMITSSLSEVVKMANAGIEDSVMLSFVTNSAGTFNLGSDQVIYLNDLGVSSQVVTAMIQHDQELASGSKPATASTVPVPLPADAMTAAAMQASQASATPPGASAPAQYAPSYTTAPQPAPPLATTAPDQAPPQTVVNYNYFHDSLSPYGNWVDVDGYGWCWQPTVTVINSGWRPYCDGGRWLYTDSGWYWASDYTWGGIAFHYGRWFSHPRWGWCWWPDTCWSPSWVTWRYSGDYCGWAALPPYTYANYTGLGLTYYGGSVALSFGFGLGWNSYTFVPWHGFADYRPSRHYLTGSRAQQAYHNSTVVNNIINGNNNTIINGGIGVDKVRQFTGTDIRRATVRDVPLDSHKGLQPDRVTRERGSLVLHRPIAPTGRFPSVAGGTGSDRSLRPPTAAVGSRDTVSARQDLAPAVRPTAPRNTSPSAQLQPGSSQPTPRQPRVGNIESQVRPAPANPPPVRSQGTAPARSVSPSRPTPAATLNSATTPVRAPVPVKLTDPIIRPQPLQAGTPNVLQVEMKPTPSAQQVPRTGVSQNRGAPGTVTKAAPTTTWQNNTGAASPARQTARQDVRPTRAPEVASTYSRPIAPTRTEPDASRFYQRALPRESAPAVERPYARSAPAPTRSYSPPPVRSESYSPPARPSYTPPTVIHSAPAYSPPPAMSAPAPRPSPSAPAPASSRSAGRGNVN